jgi:hypothetical protein
MKFSRNWSSRVGQSPQEDHRVSRMVRWNFGWPLIFSIPSISILSILSSTNYRSGVWDIIKRIYSIQYTIVYLFWWCYKSQWGRWHLQDGEAVVRFLRSWGPQRDQTPDTDHHSMLIHQTRIEAVKLTCFFCWDFTFLFFVDIAIITHFVSENPESDTKGPNRPNQRPWLCLRNGTGMCSGRDFSICLHWVWFPCRGVCGWMRGAAINVPRFRIPFLWFPTQCSWFQFKVLGSRFCSRFVCVGSRYTCDTQIHIQLMSPDNQE